MASLVFFLRPHFSVGGLGQAGSNGDSGYTSGGITSGTPTAPADAINQGAQISTNPSTQPPVDPQSSAASETATGASQAPAEDGPVCQPSEDSDYIWSELMPPDVAPEDETYDSSFLSEDFSAEDIEDPEQRTEFLRLLKDIQTAKDQRALQQAVQQMEQPIAQEPVVQQPVEAAAEEIKAEETKAKEEAREAEKKAAQKMQQRQTLTKTLLPRLKEGLYRAARGQTTALIRQQKTETLTKQNLERFSRHLTERVRTEQAKTKFGGDTKLDKKPELTPEQKLAKLSKGNSRAPAPGKGGKSPASPYAKAAKAVAQQTAQPTAKNTKPAQGAHKLSKEEKAEMEARAREEGYDGVAGEKELTGKQRAKVAAMPTIKEAKKAKEMAAHEKEKSKAELAKKQGEEVARQAEDAKKSVDEPSHICQRPVSPDALKETIKKLEKDGRLTPEQAAELVAEAHIAGARLCATPEDKQPPSFACLLIDDAPRKEAPKGKSSFSRSAPLDCRTSSALAFIGRGKGYRIAPVLIAPQEEALAATEKAGEEALAETTPKAEPSILAFNKLTGHNTEFTPDYDPNGLARSQTQDGFVRAGRIQVEQDLENMPA
ncbi:MAG: hypothetical protein HQM16_07035 [Deltaproteobacteria bacterium]|nr:hypothetical protein [Deltaproteobacteria bacterium]